MTRYGKYKRGKYLILSLAVGSTLSNTRILANRNSRYILDRFDSNRASKRGCACKIVSANSNRVQNSLPIRKEDRCDVLLDGRENNRVRIAVVRIPITYRIWKLPEGETKFCKGTQSMLLLGYVASYTPRSFRQSARVVHHHSASKAQLRRASSLSFPLFFFFFPLFRQRENTRGLRVSEDGLGRKRVTCARLWPVVRSSVGSQSVLLFSSDRSVCS